MDQNQGLVPARQLLEQQLSTLNLLASEGLTLSSELQNSRSS